MSNHSFNQWVVPVLQPDPDRPGSTTDPTDRVAEAIMPRLDEPETGFAGPPSPPVRHYWPRQYPVEHHHAKADITGT